MAFCSFSKDQDGNSTVTVESKFITKYLPEADGFAVKVYLYGLFVCGCVDSDFSLASMAEVLKTTEEKIAEAFAFWQDYDLVEILSKEPFAVQYLPVRSAVGRPKKVRYEQYADFNKELQRKMQKVGKFVSSGDYLKYMRFLEENSMQPQALLLIAEYCINKQGEAVTPSYVFNKAKKLLRGGCVTYEQVERELSNYNAHEGDLLAVFSALGIFKTPDENDYSAYRKWTETLGFSRESVVATAKKLKRGTMNGLEITLEELYEKGKLDAQEITRYLDEREAMASLAFRVGRKLGAKVVNPATYIEEYIEKWCTYGFEDSSLLDIALFCLKTERGSFEAMDSIVESLFKSGVVTQESVKEFLKEKNDELKLFAKIQEACGAIRKSATNLSLVRTWRDWNFSDEMILEAAKRSCSSGNPIPYMNKILSDWKRQDIFTLAAIPVTESGSSGKPARGEYINAAVQAVNAKSDRERYYALLREKAQKRADKFVAKANGNTRFKDISTRLSKLEIELAKADIFAPEKLPDLTREKKSLLGERRDILLEMGIDESDLVPKFTCAKCQDTGFLKGGAACDCYKK